jgi:sulfite exporter TauE/SafE
VTIVVGILVASILGSIHCAAMCGGFVCLYAGTGVPRGMAGLRAHGAYNVGRLVSYTLLGAAAGALGAGVNRLGQFAGIGRAAAIVAGTLMVLWGVGTVAAALGVRVPGTLAPDWARRRLGGALVALRDRPPAVRAAATGLLTTLLPCGWLYAFVATAGGAGSVLGGMLVMAAFWAGTVPMLLGVGLGAGRVFGPLRSRLPTVSAVLVIAFGLLAITGRVRAPAVGHAAHLHAPAMQLHERH